MLIDHVFILERFLPVVQKTKCSCGEIMLYYKHVNAYVVNEHGNVHNTSNLFKQKFERNY